MFNIVVHLAEGSVAYGFRVLGAGYSNWICHLVPLLLGRLKHVTPFLSFAIFKGQGE